MTNNKASYRDEEYFVCYTTVQNSLYCGYYDLYLIRSFSQFVKEKGKIAGISQRALEHVLFLLKKDLALTVWKIVMDQSKKAATLSRINNYLHKQYAIKRKVRVSLTDKKLTESLRYARNKYIAHNDFGYKNDTDEIYIDDLAKALDEIRSNLNLLCFSELDERVFELDDTKVNKISIDAGLGSGLLLRGYALYTEDKNQ